MRRKHHNHDTAKKVAIGSGIAAAVGYLAGILTAPKSGKQTRSDIKKTADKTVIEAEKELKKLHTELSKLIDEAKKGSTKLSSKAKKEADDLVDKAKDTKEKAREMLSAIHEGDTDDRDLKKAIKDANAAIDHLKDYIKK